MKKPQIRTLVGAVALVVGLGAGTTGLVVNAHWRADQRAAAVQAASFEDEPDILADAIDQTGVVINEDVEAIRVETARLAAEAEAARVAEEQRVAAEAAAAQAAADEAARQAAAAVPKKSTGGTTGGSGKMLVPWNPDGAGYWDTTQCPNSSASTGADGKQYCD